MGKQILSFDLAASLLEIKNEVLQWKVSTGKGRAGAKAGTVKPDGYVSVCIAGKFYQAHRVVWLLHHGSWPDGPLDHINGDRSDNRAGNLRRCTPSQNQYNRKVSRNNSTGFKGVFRSTTPGRYLARIGVNGRQRHLGSFQSAPLAALAYDIACIEAYGQFARPNFELQS